jgi:hypothetical protein
MKSFCTRFTTIVITIFAGLIILKTSLAQTNINLSVSQPPQLIVNAGEDATIDVGEDITLGGSPAATGGSGNYNYSWNHTSYLDNSIIEHPLATPPGNLTFTLTVTDENGCSESDAVSIIVIGGSGIDDNMKNLSINIFPNPGDGSFTITFSSAFNEKDLRIKVTNLSGQKVYEEICAIKPGMEKEIDISYLPEGFYILTIDGESTHHERQLIIQ